MSEDIPVLGAEEPSVNEDEGAGREADVAVREPPDHPTAFRLTVEVPMFLMFFSLSISGAVVSNLLLERTCLHTLGYNQSFCSELIAHGNKSAEVRHLEDEVQGATTAVMTARSVVEGLCPALLSLFLGVWSNKHGRKPLIVWPLFGAALSAVLMCAYSLLGGLSAWWFVGTSLPYSLGGGSSALFTGAFCLLTDVTGERDRSLRLALLEACLFVGIILGLLASPYTVAAIGTSYLLLLTACISVAAYVYAVLCIDESVEGAVEGDLRSVFDASLVREMLGTCFRRRPNFDRAVVLLLVVANSLTIFALYGLLDVDYLYARERLSWDLQQYSVFSAVNTVVLVVGLLLGVCVLQRRWRVSDTVMAMVALVSSMAQTVARIVATAATGWVMYFGSAISLLRGLSSPLIRSLISKREPPADVAKVFALMSALEAVLPVLAPLLYNPLYKSTLATLPGAVYIVTTGVYGASLATVCVAQYFILKYPVHQYAALES